MDEDRLHLSPVGHDIVAALAAALAVPGADDTWREPSPPVHPSRTETVATEFRWTIHYLAPWIGRRPRGISDREPKRPELLPARCA
ncbi:hypothetical protein OG203_02540 [Nocardia sp. NBC_01499]|uniref:hypothetical protein n=1 Tax=Nocardia sp. NBC_01499 TaxID=2903597 RepID=UPI00386EE968